MTDTEPAVVPEMPTFTARYLCGQPYCDYDRTAPWPVHQLHYERHRGHLDPRTLDAVAGLVLDGVDL